MICLFRFFRQSQIFPDTPRAMKHIIHILGCILMITLGGEILSAAEKEVVVVNGKESSFLSDALARLGIKYKLTNDIDAKNLPRDGIIVFSGKDFALPLNKADGVLDFLKDGGSVLAIGGGAKWLIETGNVDAVGYYPSGTTIFMSKFDGYHPLTFGYPSDIGGEKWNYGVPNLLRATGGPLIKPGPRAVSVLLAGGPFSHMVYQRIGKGIALLIGPDPQGGNQFLTLNEATPRKGDKLGTDRLLSNAIKWLQEPVCNLVPNPGFEEQTSADPQRFHWELITQNGGKARLQRSEAPQGSVFVLLEKPEANAFAKLAIHLPILVEPEREYRFSCLYRCQNDGSLLFRQIRTLEDPYNKAEVNQNKLPASRAWQKYQVDLKIPPGIRYLGFILQPTNSGELGIDDIHLNPIER